MSIGKKYSEGNRGNDLSFRSKVLRGLQGVFDNTDQVEGILEQILLTLGGLLEENKLDFEIKSIKDANEDVFQLRGTLDEETGIYVWDYIDAEGNAYAALDLPGGPQSPVEFLNPDGLLSLILTELEGFNDKFITEVDDDAIAVEQELPTFINLLYGAFEGEGTEWERIQTDGDGRLKGIYDLLIELTAINNNTDNVEALLTAIDTVLDNSLIQLQAINVNTDQLEALSTDIKNLLTTIDVDTSNLDVLLSTRASEATLALVLAELQAINIDTNGLNQEVTQLLIKGVLDAIKLDTANLDVALSTRATEATLLLIKGILDNIKLDTAAIDANTDGLEALLTTIDAVLDTIKTDTALINSNIVLGNITLNTIDAVLDTIKLDTGALVVDLAAIEVLITASNALLTTIDADTSNIATRTASIDTALTPTTRTHNTVSATGVGSVPAGSMCGSVINAGSAAGTWNGISLPAGVSIPWTQIGNRDTYGIINYDATGTTFIIEYTT